jgi:hypothetical protein
VTLLRALGAVLISAVLLGAVGLLFGNLVAPSHTTCHGTAGNGYCDSTKGPWPLVGLVVGALVGVAVAAIVILVRRRLAGVVAPNAGRETIISRCACSRRVLSNGQADQPMKRVAAEVSLDPRQSERLPASLLYRPLRKPRPTSNCRRAICRCTNRCIHHKCKRLDPQSVQQPDPSTFRRMSI